MLVKPTPALSRTYLLKGPCHLLASCYAAREIVTRVLPEYCLGLPALAIISSVSLGDHALVLKGGLELGHFCPRQQTPTKLGLCIHGLRPQTS